MTDLNPRADRVMALVASATPTVFGPERPIITQRLARELVESSAVLAQFSLESALGYGPAGYDALASAVAQLRTLRNGDYYGLSFDWEYSR